MWQYQFRIGETVTTGKAEKCREQSRDQVISDKEIDLDASDDPNEWSVYLTSSNEIASTQRLALGDYKPAIRLVVHGEAAPVRCPRPTDLRIYAAGESTDSA